MESQSGDKDDNSKSKSKKNAEPRAPIKNTTDFIKMKLDKLMTNFEKPVVIPERPKQKNGPNVPEFVRNVMGSSAGAGSGEFHVYRHLRRKEYARQKFIQQKSEAEQKDDEYHKKIEENLKKAEEATAKKRLKRLKKKEKQKKNKKLKVGTGTADTAQKRDSAEDESSDDEEAEGEKVET